MSETRDLGSVTSYALALRMGFVGTEAEWVNYIMEARTNAQNASQSATMAEQSAIDAAASAESARRRYGNPLVATSVAGMTDQTKVYVYTGNETGYTAGNWYYYDGSAWVSGGVYNAVASNMYLDENDYLCIS